MNSRERIMKALRHEEADRVPVDLGGMMSTGIMATIASHTWRDNDWFRLWTSPSS